MSLVYITSWEGFLRCLGRAVLSFTSSLALSPTFGHECRVAPHIGLRWTGKVSLVLISCSAFVAPLSYCR
uniref:Uncharacterized protein n=1 Tax=Ixodes ricinus TaxID=34613 RepID=A0A6B0U211_IXORI